MRGLIHCILQFCEICDNEEQSSAAVDGPQSQLSAVKVIPLPSLCPRASSPVPVRLCVAVRGPWASTECAGDSTATPRCRCPVEVEAVRFAMTDFIFVCEASPSSENFLKAPLTIKVKSYTVE